MECSLSIMEELLSANMIERTTLHANSGHCLGPIKGIKGVKVVPVEFMPRTDEGFMNQCIQMDLQRIFCLHCLHN